MAILNFIALCLCCLFFRNLFCVYFVIFNVSVGSIELCVYDVYNK